MPESADYAMSFVATARNDDHGGNLSYRMTLFARGLAEQCHRFDIPAELVLVDWNPPSNKPPLAEAIDWLEKGPLSVRVLTVSPEIHSRYDNARDLPLFQMIAKNVGIRRAQGKLVLATNVDLLFNDELMRFLASNHIDADRYYRIDRHDVPDAVPVDKGIQEQLAFCEENVLRVNSRTGTTAMDTGVEHQVTTASSTIPPIARFIPGWLKSNPLYKRLRTRQAHKTQLHTNGAGDFTLMSKKAWEALNGYPEWPIHGTNVDALICYMAFYSGLEEHILAEPMRLYHIEHGRRWSPDGFEAKKSPIPDVTNEQLFEWANEMRRKKKPIIFNDKDWGLADENIPETLVSAGKRTAG